MKKNMVTLSKAVIISLITVTCEAITADTYLGVDFDKDNLDTLLERYKTEGKTYKLQTLSSFNDKPIMQALTLGEIETMVPIDVKAKKQIIFNGYGKVMAVGYKPTKLDTNEIAFMNSIYSPMMTIGTIERTFSFENEFGSLAYRDTRRFSEIVPVERVLTRLALGQSLNCSTAIEQFVLSGPKFVSHREVDEGDSITASNGSSYKCRTPNSLEKQDGYYSGVPRLFPILFN